METILVTIDDKVYRMACDKGQEDHLTKLAAQLDQYIRHLKNNFGEIGDHRLSVMAGIMILDEIEEIKREYKKLQESHATLLQKNQEQDRHMIQIVQETTKRIEKLTQELRKDAHSLNLQ
ncbi:cell division protein ZapA [Bartonella bacilliformis]|uniref:Cell division protein ZapA n=1 Tax=Bartonella bacilliformis Ver097 TaxID=1293911 RepID=A0A072R844_BARBA|nr:cell division protein ZapA [Bartonella bacilliformis]KEG21392.1 hypothetical protein H710_00341 [Bartonella bacilliformis Ver097]